MKSLIFYLFDSFFKMYGEALFLLQDITILFR